MANIELQERDLGMLTSIGMARMLTIQAIEWLHYPQWRTHYRVYVERSQLDEQAQYKPRPRVYQRLARLRDAGFVSSIERQKIHRTSIGLYRYEPIPTVYCLTKDGVALVAAHMDEDDPIIWSPPQYASRVLQSTEHMALIGRCYAAMRAEAEYRDQTFTDWQNDYALRASGSAAGQNYDLIQLPDNTTPVSLIPDGVCRLNNQLYFLEVDRGTHRMQIWVDKLRAYDLYRGSRLLHERYETAEFQVLIIVPDQRRLERIAAEIARVCQATRGCYRLIEERLLHPTTIRRGWRKVEQATFAPRMIGGRLRKTVKHVTLEQAPLWQTEANS